MSKGKAAVSTAARIEYMDLEDIQTWPRNPKRHDMASLQMSLKRFGMAKPLVRDDATGRLVAGHGRLEALLDLQAGGEEAPRYVTVDETGAWWAPVLVGKAFKDELEAEAYLIADNRLVETGGWDARGLRDMLDDLRGQDSGAVQGLGWSAADLRALLLQGQERPGQAPPEERPGYMDVGPRQVVVYLTADEYAGAMATLGRAAEHYGVTGEAATLAAMLREYAPAEAA